MTKLRRNVGKGNPRGETKRKILLMSMEKYPGRIEEPEILNKLWAKDHISDNAGIRRHLRDLVKKGIEYNEDEGWAKLREDANFQLLAEEFLGSEHAMEFIRTPYAQKMINSDLLWKIAKIWASGGSIAGPPSAEEVAAFRMPRGEPPGDFKSMPHWVSVTMEYYNRNFKEKKEVLQILRLSPTALGKALQGPRELSDLAPEISQEYLRNRLLLSSEYFWSMLLSSLILDFSTFRYPGFELGGEIIIDLNRDNRRDLREKPRVEKLLHEERSFRLMHAPPRRAEGNTEAGGREVGVAGGDRANENGGQATGLGRAEEIPREAQRGGSTSIE